LKAGKIDLEKQKIGQMQQEAAQRYSAAMDAAGKETWIAAFSCAAAGLSAVSGACGLGDLATAKSVFEVAGKVSEAVSKGMQAAWTRSIAQDKNTADKQTMDGKQSDKTQLKILEADRHINEADQQAADAKDAKEQARDRRKASLDNIQKLLDIVRGMNVQI
jgi:hypothetical protein